MASTARRALLLSLAVLLAGGFSEASSDVFEAIDAGNSDEISRFLAEDPSSLNSRGPGGQTPLMRAVLKGVYKAARLLLEAGADFTIPEKDGYTPMHGAGFQGRHDLVPLLVKHGVPINDVHADGARSRPLLLSSHPCDP